MDQVSGGCVCGALDQPDLFRPSYELWTRRREGWLPAFPGVDAGAATGRGQRTRRRGAETGCCLACPRCRR